MRIPAAAMFAILLFTFEPTASAQGDLEQDGIPDISAIEAAVPMGSSRSERVGRRGLDVEAAIGAGDLTGVEAGGVIAAGLGLGLRHGRTILSMRSDLDGLAPAEGEKLELDDMRGRHRAIAIAQVGDRGELGWIVAADALLRHSGRKRFLLAPARFGHARAVAGEVGLSAGIRLGVEPAKDGMAAIPVSYRAESIRWLDDDSPVSRANSQEVGIGFGLAPTEHEFLRGTIHFMRGVVRHTTIKGQTGIAAAGAPTMDRSIRSARIGAGADDLVLFDGDFMAAIDVHLGWAWLRGETPGGEIDDNLFDFKTAANLKFGGTEKGSSRVGFHFGREPTHSGSGDRLLADWRLDLSAELEKPTSEIQIGGGVGWLQRLAGNESHDALLRYGTKLAAFYKLPLGLQIGAYHSAAYEPDRSWDPWTSPRRWTQEGGLLLRFKASTNAVRPSVRRTVEIDRARERRLERDRHIERQRRLERERQRRTEREKRFATPPPLQTPAAPIPD